MVEQDGSVLLNSIPKDTGDGDVNTSTTEKYLSLHPGQHFRRYFFGNEQFQSDSNTQEMTRGSIYQPSAF